MRASDAAQPDPTDPPLVVGTAGQSAAQPDPTDPPLVVGTAGHIDHGKTALVTLLTGTNTDRLREERERGISIELGYAELLLPSGRRLSVVDVPGHERFVRTMVAGATGVDLFLLVVAADDGVMPQTVEHLAIIGLLGVERGVVALTKADLVDGELLALARADVEALLKGTRYEGSPIVAVSSRDGRGIPELLGALEEAAAATHARRREGPARLPVDRVFSLKGIGTVATGTLWRGEIRPGDRLSIEPGGHQVTVRDVQVHEHDRPLAVAGQRVGVSLRGAELHHSERGTLHRGAWLVAPSPAARTTDTFEAWVELLPGTSGVRSGERVRLHHGTGQSVARLQLLDRDLLLPEVPGAGAREQPAVGAPARIRLEGPDSVEPGDRFILRALSPPATLGGGIVLDAELRRWRDRSAHVRYLAALRDRDAATAVVEVAAAGGPAGVTVEEMTATTIGDAAAAALAAAERCGGLESGAGGRRWFSPGVLRELEARLLEVLERRARERPDRPALSLAESAAALARRGKAPGCSAPSASARSVPDDVVADLAARLVTDGRAVQTGEGLAHPSAGALDPRRQALAAEVTSALSSDPFSPPTVAALQDRLDAERRDIMTVLDVLARRGDAVRVKEDLYFSAAAIAAARERLVQSITTHGPITLAAYRDLLGCGRRNAQALLEHFDGEGLTRRDGERRVLRRRRS